MRKHRVRPSPLPPDKRLVMFGGMYYAVQWVNFHACLRDDRRGGMPLRCLRCTRHGEKILRREPCSVGGVVHVEEQLHQTWVLALAAGIEDRHEATSGLRGDGHTPAAPVEGHPVWTLCTLCTPVPGTVGRDAH